MKLGGSNATLKLTCLQFYALGDKITNVNLKVKDRITHLTFKQMVHKTSDKQISRTFPGLFKEKLQFSRT